MIEMILKDIGEANKVIEHPDLFSKHEVERAYDKVEAGVNKLVGLGIPFSAWANKQPER